MKKQRLELITQLGSHGLLLMFALLTLCTPAHADGGLVVLHQETGPFIVTVFTAPNPLRAGPVDISVLVQNPANDQPVLDGDVLVRLRSEGGMTLKAQATREMAQNKLLYSALMTLPEAGRWEMAVTIKQGDQAASILGQVSAAAPRPFLLSYWRSLSLPPIFVGLFVLNQWLKRRIAPRITSRRPVNNTKGLSTNSFL